MINLRSFFVSSVLTITSLSVMAADLISMKQIYNYASKQDVSSLKKIKNQLETLDSKGNTAVCQAILNEDVKTYNTLIRAGANANAPCVKNIPQTTYNDFMASVAQSGMAGGDVAAAGTAVGTTATATSTGTFLGMGAVGWGITGAVVVGGAAAAAAGGGGGGGGSGGATPVPNPCAGITCGTNAFCSAGSCICNTGYEGDAETECTLIPLDCHNGNQTGTKCTCDEGWTGSDCTQPVNCGYTTTSCGDGYTATGNTCKSGTNTYTECTPNDCSNYQATCGEGYDATQSCLSGTTPYYTCTPKDVPEGYTSTPCTEGYEQDGATFISGETNYYKCKEKDCSAYETSCGAGYNEVQSCLSGTVPYYTCIPKEVPSGYTSIPCTGGYEQDGETFISGTENYYKCKAIDCAIQGYEISCGTGYDATQSCLSGTIPYYTCTPKSVPDGFQIAECGSGYDEIDTFISSTTTYHQCTEHLCGTGYEIGTTCENGYHQEGSLCLSGTTNYIHCVANDCSQYQTDCGSGYNKEAACNSAGQVYYNCIPNICPDGYNTLGESCPQGYTQEGDICESGDYSYVKCNIASCPATHNVKGSCGIGYEQVGEPCYSGGDTYFQCTEVTCPYENTSCGDGYIATGNTCPSGNTVYVECVENTCDGFIEGSCPDNSVCSYCQKGNTQTYKITDCVSGYELNGTGVCVLKKSDDIIGSTSDLNNNTIEINNVTYADVYGQKIQENKMGGYRGYNNGTVQISNEANGDVYGTYNVGVNAGPYTSGTINQTGLIEITNEGDGNVSGMYKGNINAYAVSSYTGNNLATGTITLNNTGNGNVYGMNDVSSYSTVQYNAYGTGSVANHTATAWGSINITNEGNGSVYGIYGRLTHNAGVTNNGSSASAGITITNTGTGDVYGIKSNEVENSYSYTTTSAPFVSGTITINNEGTGDVYGIRGGTVSNLRDIGSRESSVINANIAINTTGNASNVYGLYGSTVTNLKDSVNSNAYALTSEINIKNIGSGNIFGIYASNGYNYDNYNNKGNTTGTKNASIYLANSGNGDMIGIYGSKKASNTFGSIRLNNAGNGRAIGLKTASAGVAENGSQISIIKGSFSANGETYNVLESKSGTAIGIYAEENANITNSGIITITGAETGYGIYAKGNGGTIINSGTIDVKATNAYGIFVENGTGITVTNTGTIKLNDIACTGDCSGNTDNGNYIVLNGATLINANVVSAQSINIASIGGNMVAAPKAKFNITNQFSGPLGLSADLTTYGFDTTYVAENMINAGDTSKLQLKSQSALFDASLRGNDVVMKMKSFDTVTDNSSFAQFLATNYALGQNEAFFNTLKQIGSMSELTGSLDKMMGKEMLSRFAFEDMTMMRELNFDMNNHLFNNKESYFSIGGSVSSPMAFKGDNGSNSRYSLSSKSDGVWSIGLGVAFTDIRSDDDNDNNSRSDTMYQMIMPIGYKTAGFHFMTSPRLGYARGSYDRIGFNDKSYDGTIEKRIFGLMNEARYPINVGDWKFEPAVEFNALGYEQKGWEDKKEFSLNIPTQRTYSVESGIGLYATHEKELNKDSKFKFTAGVAAYHEFADPYKMDVGMNGLSGHFTLRDENRSDNRAVARTGFEFNKGDYSLTGSFISYIDRETRTKANLGFKWKF